MPSSIVRQPANRTVLSSQRYYRRKPSPSWRRLKRLSRDQDWDKNVKPTSMVTGTCDLLVVPS